jgi:UDP-glucose 4-epimerase
MAILVTGGAGYIGSHTVVELLNEGYNVIIIDNLYNSKKDVIDRIKEITGKDVIFYEGDVADRELLENIFSNNKIDAVMHFAGYKAVGESVEKPLMYYHNNILSTIILCEVMQEYNVKNIVFSSSATVYGNPGIVEYTEELEIKHATNPYGETKIMNEQILKDLYVSDNSWNIALLRYFNPIGAHKSGLIGENPNDIPNNLMPYIVKVAIGELKELSIFGNDYNTKDGTGVRDYIHVVDLAKAHIKALEWTFDNNGIDAFNIGTGCGYSVLEIVNAFIKYNGVDVPYKIAPRREGDIAECYADPSKAKKELGFEATKTL